jgi:hypothetical protein
MLSLTVTKSQLREAATIPGVDTIDIDEGVEAVEKQLVGGEVPAILSPMKRQEERTGYGVFAKDGNDRQATNETEQFLQQLVGVQNVRPPQIRSSTGTLDFWTCNSESSSPFLKLDRLVMEKSIV